MPDLGSMGEAVGALLKSREETIAIAESSAGGLISASLLSVPGASAYFIGGGVLYTYDSRHKFLNLPEDHFEGMRPSTEEYALHMARAVRDHLGATWGVGETGATGPTGNRYGDAAGHACVAVAGPVDGVITLETASTGREANMWAFTNAALKLIEATIKKNT